MSRSRDFGAAAGSLAAPSSSYNGYAHVVDTTQASGWNFAGTSYAGKNLIINGGMDFWSRGTTFNPPQTTNVYIADRWFPWSNYTGTSSITISRQASDLPGFQYFMRHQRPQGTTQASSIYLNTALETVNCIPYAGKPVTLSFYARCGSGYTGGISAYVGSGTGTDQNSIGGFTGNLNLINTTTPNLTSTGGIINGWQRYISNGTVPSNSTQLCVVFYYGTAGTASANEYIDITGVQLELGNVATPFSRAGGSIGGELALCQRYFEKSYDISVAPGTVTQIGAKYSSGSVGGLTTSYINDTFQYKVTKRAIPSTVIIYDLSGNANKVNREYFGVSSTANQNATLSYTGTNGISLYSSGTASAGSISYQYTVDSEIY